MAKPIFFSVGLSFELFLKFDLRVAVRVLVYSKSEKITLKLFSCDVFIVAQLAIYERCFVE